MVMGELLISFLFVDHEHSYLHTYLCSSLHSYLHTYLCSSLHIVYCISICVKRCACVNHNFLFECVKAVNLWIP